MKYFFCLVALTLSLSASAQKAGKDKPFVLGITKTINSRELSEKRILNIYLPDGYKDNDTARYPVIYLLDGSANEDFIHISGLVQFFTMLELMPKTIVVGIANVDRKRDYTFPTTVEKDKKDYPTTGSSARFISFIQKDLQPFIEATYRTNGSRTIVGQSLGGLVATEILLKKPSLFNNYIIVSPSLWWDNESLLHQAPALLHNLTDNKTRVYISVGKEGDVMEGDAKGLVEALQKNTPQVQVTFDPLYDENHLTILHIAAYRAFNKLFRL